VLVLRLLCCPLPLRDVVRELRALLRLALRLLLLLVRFSEERLPVLARPVLEP